MAVLDDNHPAITGSAAHSWQDVIKNSKIILFELDKAIIALMQEGIRGFTLNTGMTTQTVTNQDLPILIQRRDDLLEQIKKLESFNAPPAMKTKVVPAW